MLLETSDDLNSVSLLESIVMEGDFLHGVRVSFNCRYHRFDTTSTANIFIHKFNAGALLVFNQVTGSRHDLHVRASLHVRKSRVFHIVFFTALVFEFAVTLV